MSNVIADDTKAEADWLAEFETLELDVHNLNDAATQRQRGYRWVVVGFVIVAVALQLTSPTGLPPLLFGALIAFLCVALFLHPMDIATAALYGYMQHARETVDAWRASKTTFNALTAVVDIKQVAAEVEQIKAKGLGGRPRSNAHDWAWEQMNIENRDHQEVYEEWLVKIGKSRFTLVDPKDSFNHAINPKRPMKILKKPPIKPAPPI